MATAREIMLEFVEAQGWNDDSVVGLLLNFIESRRSYWPGEEPQNATGGGMEADLRSFLNNVADEENSWTNVEGREEFDNHGPDGWVFADEDGNEVGFAEPNEYRTAEHAVEKFGREYGDGDFDVYFRKDNVAYSCSPEDTPSQFQHFEVVHPDD